MKEPGLNFAIGLIVICLVLISYSVIKAQSGTTAYERNRSNVSLSLLIPDFDRETGMEISGFVIIARSELNFKEKSYYIFEIPVGHATRPTGFMSNETKMAFGNPYAGLKVGKDKSPFTVEVGMRIPLVSNKRNLAAELGWITDIEHLDAFIPDYFTFKTMFNLRLEATGNLTGEISLGPKVLVYTGDSDCPNETETIIDYGLRGHYQSEKFDVGVGLTGLICLTEDEFMGEDRTINFLKFESGYNTGNTRPGIEIRLPVDETFDEVLDMILGLNFKYYFN